MKSFPAPKGSSFISSTTPLVFVSVLGSYFGRLASSFLCPCASPAVEHKSTNKGTKKSTVVALLGRMWISRLSSTAPPECSRKPNVEGKGPLYVHLGSPQKVCISSRVAYSFVYDKAVTQSLS